MVDRDIVEIWVLRWIFGDMKVDGNWERRRNEEITAVYGETNIIDCLEDSIAEPHKKDERARDTQESAGRRGFGDEKERTTKIELDGGP